MYAVDAAAAVYRRSQVPHKPRIKDDDLQAAADGKTAGA
jgi:hypothetical protein